MSDRYREGPCLQCGQPGRRYVNAHWCTDHAPHNPTPDPARTLAGVRAAAGITPPPLPERVGRGPSLRRRLDTPTATDVSGGVIEPDGDNAIWRCGLCNVSGVTSPKSAPVALAAHLRYRHPTRAEKVAERASEAPQAPVVGQ